MLICFIFVLLIAPSVKTMTLIFDNDNTIPLAAEWLVEHHLKKNTKIATNDAEVWFYIDLELNKRPDEPTFVYHRQKNNLKIEKFALRKKAGIIILKFKNRKINDLPQFKHFKKIQSFGSNKYTTHIYNKINGT